jgi:uncharacterized protein
MPESQADPTIPLPLSQPTPTPPRSTRDLAIETGVVILICIIPSLFTSIASLYLPHGQTSFLYQSLYSTIRSFGWIALVLFMISRSGEPWTRFGLKRFQIVLDLLAAVVIYLFAHVASHILWTVILFLEGHSLIQISRHGYMSFAPPSGAGAYAILALMTLSNGFAEEIVVRTYLITRFEQLFGSTGLALLFSTILFAGYHIYQGPAGVISTAFFGLIFGAIFCLFRRLWPLALAHALWDFISFATMK